MAHQRQVGTALFIMAGENSDYLDSAHTGQHWNNAIVPYLGGKNDAATFDPATAEKVLSHLRTIDHRFTEAKLI